jgi:hypothetical protein
MAKPKQIKVCLMNRGDDTETPWAVDLGPAPGPSGSRKVRLINVPFMHAKPTWGDTIVVSPVEDGFPTWDRNGTPWPQIGTRIVEDGGRWAMIVDYAPHPDATGAFQSLARACAEHDVVCEGAWGPRAGEPGRAYFAVAGELTDAALMKALRAADLPCELIQIHPEPQIRPNAKAAKVAAKPATAAKAAAKPAPRAVEKAPAKPAKAAATKPVAKKPTKGKSAAKKSQPKRRT